MAEPEITAATTIAIAVRINPRDWFNGETFCGPVTVDDFSMCAFCQGGIERLYFVTMRGGDDGVGALAKHANETVSQASADQIRLAIAAPRRLITAGAQTNASNTNRI